MHKNNLEKLAKLVRYNILTSTTEAGTGHPTSSMSATEVMVGLMFGGFFKADLENPQNLNNDRLIFSKGHASPLFYSLYAVAGQKTTSPQLSPHHLDKLGVTLSDSRTGQEGREILVRAFDPVELLSLRKFGSRFEGHPTMEFKYTEVPTGSLGQGLSVGVGMALNAKADKLDYKTFVLLGDSEVAEGSIWEAMDSAAHYKLNNLIAILDCNRLGQRGETMFGHKTDIYEAKAKAFGWETVVIDGHDFQQIESAFAKATADTNKTPTMIIAKTLKGKGVSFVEDKEGWHGKALSKEELVKALEELGEVDKNLVGEVEKPANQQISESGNQLVSESVSQEISKSASQLDSSQQTVGSEIVFTDYPTDKKVATRKAFGNALVNIAEAFPNMVVLDAEVSNSTYTEFFKKKYPERFYEMYIAEQNMVGVATGLDKRGKLVFASTFAAFYARAFDQVRMSQYAMSNIKFVQSHAGVSIGEDGASQMALEDLAMFRAVQGVTVLYPSDPVSAEKITFEAAKHKGAVYIRNTRMEANVIYDLKNDDFKIGGSKTLKSSATDVATIIGAGVTLHEALKAYAELQKEGINIRVIDLYSIKPLDIETLKKAAKETKNIITVEDHYIEGGIGEAVASALSSVDNLPSCKFKSLAVSKMPRSGKPEELLAYEEIDSAAIVRAVRQVVASSKL